MAVNSEQEMAGLDSSRTAGRERTFDDEMPSDVETRRRLNPVCSIRRSAKEAVDVDPGKTDKKQYDGVITISF